MDWDWDDGPPRDTPRRRPEEPPLREEEHPLPEKEPPLREEEPLPGAAADPAPFAGASDPAPFAGAVERFQEPVAPAQDRQPRREDRPPLPEDQDGPRFGRRPRPPADRAAARAHRRRQVRRRRLIALVVIAIAAVLFVALVVRGCGGPSEGQAAGASSPPGLAALRVPAAAEPLLTSASSEPVGGAAQPGIKLLAVAALSKDWRLPALREEL